MKYISILTFAFLFSTGLAFADGAADSGKACAENAPDQSSCSAPMKHCEEYCDDEFGFGGDGIDCKVSACKTLNDSGCFMSCQY